MSCCGDREKVGGMKVEQKWDYINLDDFHSRSCWTPLSYATLWILLFISVAVYAVDTFTAINLLIFSRWAGQIEPAIPFHISRWIFVACIIISFILLAFRWLRTIRVIKSGSVAESYLDPLTVRVQSIRFGEQGRGWKRFLVYAELTKSKKGADYVALFSYFSFEAWLRIVFADGPRQVVNALTLYSVAQLNLIPEGHHAAPEGKSAVTQFFLNIQALAEKDTQRALVLFGILFTVIIWVFAALSLLLSVILYLVFLFHHIPSEDGTLKRYCRRKINTRLERIVKRKVNKALAKGLALQDRGPSQADGLGGAPKPLQKAPTLPSLEKLYDDKLPNPSLSRQTTQTTLPPYSRPGTTAPDEKLEFFPQSSLPNVGFDDKPPLVRTTTQSSAFSDSTSLVGNAAVMGYSHFNTESPVLPMVDNSPYPKSQTPRSYTSISRPTTAQGRSTAGPPPMDRHGRRTPADPAGGMPPPDRMYGPPRDLFRTLPPIDVNVPRSDGDPMIPIRYPTPASTSSPPGSQRNGVYMAFNQNLTNPRGFESRVQTPRQNLMRPSTTSPSNEFGPRPPPPHFHRPSTTSPLNSYGRPPPRPPTTAPSGINNYRSPSANFVRPSTTPPSNGDRPSPHRPPQRSNTSQWTPGSYDDDGYGRAI